jgi:membrane protease YdiL (CAAX protease family)
MVGIRPSGLGVGRASVADNVAPSRVLMRTSSAVAKDAASADRMRRIHDEVRCMLTSVSSPPHVNHPSAGPDVNPLEEAIRRLPAGVEFLVVVTWAFGLPIFASIMALGTPADSTGSVFTNAELLATVIFEVIQLGFLTWFLRIRGWTLEKFGLSFSWRGTAVGVVLLAITYGLALGAQYIAQFIFNYDLEAAAARAPKVDPDLSMQLVFLVSVVNGIFEELFVAGYIITSLIARRGMWMAINVSVVVRLLYHLYQGPIGIMTVVPMGLLYGYAYVRTRQLWPLMVAHVLLDVVGLASAT